MTRNTGQIVSRGRDRWLVRVFLGRDSSGTRKYVSKTVHGKKKDADRVRRELLQKRDQGRLVVPTNMTVAQFLEKWLRDAVSPRVQESTLRSYRDALNANVLPHIGNVIMRKLSPLHVQQLVAKLSRKGLAPRTIRYPLGLLRSSLRQAVKWRLLDFNPSEDVQLPRKRQRELVLPSREELGRLVEECKRDSLSPLWLLMLSTGLRPGECLALKWPDIDFENDRLVVQRALSRVPGEGWMLRPPKTSRGRRTVTLPADTSKLLYQHRRIQLEMRLKAGASWIEHGFVFSGRNGEPLDWSQVRRMHWIAIAKGAGLPGLKPYDLRHLHASILLSEGVPLRAISDRLGHFDPGFTLATYTHTLPGTQEAAAKVMDVVLRGAMGDD